MPMMIDMDTVSLDARDFFDPQGSVVDCAARIAHEVVRQLSTGAAVCLSVHGLRGVSSSFFNVILSAVFENFDRSVRDRFRVDTETDTQRIVYERSLDAFLRRTA